MFKYFKYQCLKTFKAENCDIGFHHLSRKTYYWNKTSVRMSTCIAIIDSKTVGTPATQPHTHIDTDGMMSDPTRAATHHVLQPTGRAKMTCPDRCAPPPRHQTALGQYIEKCPIPGWRATPLPTACHSDAEEIDRNTGNAQTPARPEWYDNARSDTQATRRPSQVQPHTRQATPDRPDTRDRRFTTHGTRRLSSEWEQPDPAMRRTIRPGSPVTQARPNLVDPQTSSDPGAAGEPHRPLSENNWSVINDRR